MDIFSQKLKIFRMRAWVSLLLFSSALFSAQIQEKVLICGIGRNIEAAVPNTIRSTTELGSRFLDYRVILYENNSHDQTKALLRKWAEENPKVLLRSENLSKKQLAKELSMKVLNRTELIARARNIVLNTAMKKEFDDYKYVIWADLDFLEPWDVESIVETILHPSQEWDAVFAYGAYDLFALRSAEWPIGFELLGLPYLAKLKEIEKEFILDREGPWKKVYSAFGGLGIYKREALRGCRYSGVVTKDLETVTLQWLQEARAKENICFLRDYEELLSQTTPIDLPLLNREQLPDQIGVKIPKGKIVWFSCTPNTTLPWTCEHVPLHASMSLLGHDKLFINPKIHCQQNPSREFSKRASSYPYLSGDTWRFFADWKVAKGEKFNPKKVQVGDTIFVEYAKLPHFAAKILPKIRNRFILITPNCEFGTDNPQPGSFAYLLKSNKIAAWFVQNIDQAPTERLIPIPIGLANQVWEHGQISILNPILSSAPPPASNQRDRFLYINFSLGTNATARLPCLQQFKNIAPESPKPFQDYLSDLSHTLFVPSPPGNGLDCHRTWEALLMGCYPIVLSSTLNPLYEDLPVVIVQNWEEATDEFLSKKLEEFKSRTWTTEKLYAPYWFDKVRKIQKNLRDNATTSERFHAWLSRNN